MSYPVDLKATPFLPCFPPGVVAWIDVFGYAVPYTWGDVPAEYRAIRQHAAMMDFSMLLKFDVEGHGAIETVNKVFSRDLTKLRPGRIAYGVVTTEAGRMVDDCTAFLHNANHVRVIGVSERVGEFLKQQANPNVTITDRRDDIAHLTLQGPKSRAILQKLTKTDLSNAALPYYTFNPRVEVAGIQSQISRLGFTGELGYEIMVPVHNAAKLWQALQEAGQHEGLLPFGQTAIMVARIEAGLVVGGLDYTDDTTPFECRLGWTVDLKKERFQGKEALKKLKDNVRTNVVSVVLSSAENEYSDCRLIHDGHDVGIAPMVLSSPYLGGKLLAMATVNAALASVGTRFIVGGHPNVVAEVVQTPVYDPERIRARS